MRQVALEKCNRQKKLHSVEEELANLSLFCMSFADFSQLEGSYIPQFHGRCMLNLETVAYVNGNLFQKCPHTKFNQCQSWFAHFTNFK